MIHLFLFNKRNLKKILEQTGYSIIKSKTWGSIPKNKKRSLTKGFCDRFVKLTGLGDVVCYLAKKRNL